MHPKKRKPDMRRISTNRSYTAVKLAECLRLSVATIRAWIREGLPTLDQQKPMVISGQAAKVWLKAKWQARKQKCAPDQMYCCGCRQPRRPGLGTVFVMRINLKKLLIKARCEVCDARMNKSGSVSKLGEIIAVFESLMPQQVDLAEFSNPVVKHHLQKDTDK